jgi:hypothetical protein
MNSQQILGWNSNLTYCHLLPFMALEQQHQPGGLKLASLQGFVAYR